MQSCKVHSVTLEQTWHTHTHKQTQTLSYLKSVSKNKMFFLKLCFNKVIKICNIYVCISHNPTNVALSLSLFLQPLQTLPSHRPRRVLHRKCTNIFPSLFVLQRALHLLHRQTPDSFLHYVNESDSRSVSLPPVHYPGMVWKLWQKSLFSVNSKTFLPHDSWSSWYNILTSYVHHISRFYFLTVAKLTKEKHNFYAVFFRYNPVCVCLCLFACFLAPECLAAQTLGILIRRRSQTLVLILAQNCICLKTRSDHVLPIVITPQQEWYVCFHCSHWYERGIVFKLRWWHSSNFIIHLNLQTWQQDPSTKGMFSVFLSITLESYFSEI